MCQRPVDATRARTATPARGVVEWVSVRLAPYVTLRRQRIMIHPVSPRAGVANNDHDQGQAAVPGQDHTHSRFRWSYDTPPCPGQHSGPPRWRPAVTNTSDPTAPTNAVIVTLYVPKDHEKVVTGVHVTRVVAAESFF